MENFLVKSVEKKLKESREVGKWEVLAWLSFLMERTRDYKYQRETIETLEKIVKTLPFAIVSSLEGNIGCNRCCIISVKESEGSAKRISECIADRHPYPQKFPITPLIQKLLESQDHFLYLEDPEKNNLTQQQLEIIRSEEINAIYLTLLSDPTESLIIAADATGSKKSFSLEEKKYLDALVTIISQIQKLKLQTMRAVQLTKINTMSIFLASILHLLKNRMHISMGLFKKLTDDIAKARNIEPIIKMLSKETELMGKTFLQLDELAHNISKIDTVNIEAYPLGIFLGDVSQHARENNIILQIQAVAKEDIQKVFIATDKRKLTKSVIYIAKKIFEGENKRDNKIFLTVDPQTSFINLTISAKNSKEVVFRTIENLFKLEQKEDDKKISDIVFLRKVLSRLSVEDINLILYLAILPIITEGFAIDSSKKEIRLNLARHK